MYDSRFSRVHIWALLLTLYSQAGCFDLPSVSSPLERYANDEYISLYSCTTPRVNPNGNCGFWVIMMYQCRFINCKKCTPVVGPIDNGGGYTHVRSGRCIGNLCTSS